MDCTGYFQKVEVHKGIYWYSTDQNTSTNLIAIPVERVKEIQEINRKGKKVDKLTADDSQWQSSPASYDLLKDNSLTRFDHTEENRDRFRHNRQGKKKNKRYYGKKSI